MLQMKCIENPTMRNALEQMSFKWTADNHNENNKIKFVGKNGQFLHSQL